MRVLSTRRIKEDSESKTKKKQRLKLITKQKAFYKHRMTGK